MWGNDHTRKQNEVVSCICMKNCCECHSYKCTLTQVFCIGYSNSVSDVVVSDNFLKWGKILGTGPNKTKYSLLSGYMVVVFLEIQHILKWICKNIFWIYTELDSRLGKSSIIFLTWILKRAFKSHGHGSKMENGVIPCCIGLYYALQTV